MNGTFQNQTDLKKYLLMLKVWRSSHFITSNMIIQWLLKREPGQEQV